MSSDSGEEYAPTADDSREEEEEDNDEVEEVAYRSVDKNNHGVNLHEWYDNSNG